jgi:hypothetical protein
MDKFFASLTDPMFDGPPDMLRRVQKLAEPIALEVFDKRFYIRIERDCTRPRDGRVFIQLVYYAKCNSEGNEKEWHGRKWYLSPHMIDDEIIKTVFLAFKVVIEHEVLEGFKYDGKAVFNPHVNFEELVKIATREVARENVN